MRKLFSALTSSQKPSSPSGSGGRDLHPLGAKCIGGPQSLGITWKPIRNAQRLAPHFNDVYGRLRGIANPAL